MTPLLLAVLLMVQDTSTIDRGVRIGIIYRPGVRPGLVMLPRKGGGLDSARAMIARDLDYSDRFEIITLPGGDSIRLASPNPPRTTTTRRTTSGTNAGAQAAGSLNYPLYQALGADFALDVTAAGDTTLATLHDIAAGSVRRTVRAQLPPAGDPEYRLAVHRLADQALQAALGTPGTAATRILFVKDGKVYQIDQDGADQKLVSSTDKQAMSPRGPRMVATLRTWNSRPGRAGSITRQWERDRASARPYRRPARRSTSLRPFRPTG